eukprot:scaffold45550_cov20-Tisochrysis_lutea.AAC.1
MHTPSSDATLAGAWLKATQPCPHCPQLPSPQVHTCPPSVTAALLAPPPDTCTTRVWASARTHTGTHTLLPLNCPLDPTSSIATPTCPWLLHPHAHTPCVAMAASVCEAPHATCATGAPRRSLYTLKIPKAGCIRLTTLGSDPVTSAPPENAAPAVAAVVSLPQPQPLASPVPALPRTSPRPSCCWLCCCCSPLAPPQWPAIPQRPAVLHSLALHHSAQQTGAGGHCIICKQMN